MFVWIMISVSLVCAWVGYKKGLFVMFATLFNLMFAVFIAVLTTPKLLSYSAGYETSGNYAAATVMLLFILIFGLLQFFACFYFLRDRDELFPKLLHKAGGMVFGFLSGYVICCILMLSFCIMPCSTEAGGNHVCSRDQLQELSVPGIRTVCNFLAWYSLHCFEGNSEKSITRLLDLATGTMPAQDSPDTDLLPETAPKQNSLIPPATL